VLESVVDSAGRSGMSTSSSSELSDEDELSLSSFSFAGSNEAALERPTDASSDVSSLSDASGVGE
jgi:hypothetical protein